MVHVRHHDFELVVGIHTGDQAAFENFRAFADGAFKTFEAFRGVPVHADQHVGGQRQTEFLAVQQGDLAQDVTISFQLFDPA